MKYKIIKALSILILLSNYPAFSQEWKSLKSYQKETKNLILTEGCWLKKDRKNQTEIWKHANKFNLKDRNGNKKYVTISQKRDFYLWFDTVIKKQGHEINWVGIAFIAASQLSYLDKDFIRLFIVHNKEVVQFANEGSELVFTFAFPQLFKICFSKETIKGKTAENWDRKYGKIEQCEVLEPLYKNLSEKALKRLNSMAKGKGVISFGVPKELKYVGEIEDCELRYEHGINKLLPFYLNNY